MADSFITRRGGGLDAELTSGPSNETSYTFIENISYPSGRYFFSTNPLFRNDQQFYYKASNQSNGLIEKRSLESPFNIVAQVSLNNSIQIIQQDNDFIYAGKQNGSIDKLHKSNLALAASVSGLGVIRSLGVNNLFMGVLADSNQRYRAYHKSNFSFIAQTTQSSNFQQQTDIIMLRSGATQYAVCFDNTSSNQPILSYYHPENATRAFTSFQSSMEGGGSFIHPDTSTYSSVTEDFTNFILVGRTTTAASKIRYMSTGLVRSFDTSSFPDQYIGGADADNEFVYATLSQGNVVFKFRKSNGQQLPNIPVNLGSEGGARGVAFDVRPNKDFIYVLSEGQKGAKIAPRAPGEPNAVILFNGFTYLKQ